MGLRPARRQFDQWLLAEDRGPHRNRCGYEGGIGAFAEASPRLTDVGCESAAEPARHDPEGAETGARSIWLVAGRLVAAEAAPSRTCAGSGRK